jgi:hypothetical protein
VPNRPLAGKILALAEAALALGPKHRSTDSGYPVGRTAHNRRSEAPMRQARSIDYCPADNGRAWTSAKADKLGVIVARAWLAREPK